MSGVQFFVLIGLCMLIYFVGYFIGRHDGERER